MNDSDIELFRKPKIIEIGSVEKKLRLLKVGDFSKKSGNPRKFIADIRGFGPETVLGSVIFLVLTPPLVVGCCETRGGLIRMWSDPQNFPLRGAKKSAKNLIFGRFRTS